MGLLEHLVAVAMVDKMWMISKNDDLRSMHVHLPFNTHAYNILRHTLTSVGTSMHTFSCTHTHLHVSPQMNICLSTVACTCLHTYLYRCMCYRRMHVERHTHASLQAHLRLHGHSWRCVFYYIGTCIHPPHTQTGMPSMKLQANTCFLIDMLLTGTCMLAGTCTHTC